MSNVSPFSDEFLINWLNNHNSITPRHVNRQEKHCLNCEHKQACWGENQEDMVRLSFGLRPEEFRLTSNTGNRTWNAEEYAHHLQGVFAQQCARFRSNDPEIRQRQEAAEIRRNHQQEVEKAKDKGWDY